MTKLLSARDLLEVVRLGDSPERDNIEVIVSPDTLGRRIYAGTTTKRVRRPVPHHPQSPRRDTVKIESSALERAQAQALRRGTSARGNDDRSPPSAEPASPRRPSSAPVAEPARPVASPLALHAKEPTPAPWDFDNAPTVPPEPGSNAELIALNQAQTLPPARSLASPLPAARTPLVPPAALPPQEPFLPADRSGAASRKVPKAGWSRPGDSAPVSRPAPVSLAATARLPIDTNSAGFQGGGFALPVPGIPTQPQSPAPPPAQPKSSVASMFSWVTQRADWAPPPESIAAPTQPSEPPPALPPLVAAAPIAPPLAPAAPALTTSLTAKLAPPAPKPAPLPAVTEAPQEERSLRSEERIALSGEETMVLLNYDPTVKLEVLADRTGLTEFRVSHVVANLRRRGVLDDEPEAEVQRREEHATLVDMELPPLLQPAAPASAPPPSNRNFDFESHPTLLEMDLAELSQVSGAEDATYVDDGAVPVEARRSEPHSRPLESPLSTQPLELDTGPSCASVAPGAAEDDADPPEESEPSEKAAATNYLAHFERVLSVLTIDERARIASLGHGIDLFALVYDKEPDVFRALWDNINVSNEHARFAAFHHRTAAGLDVLSQRGEFFKDPQVQRRVLRNPMVSEGLLRRILLPKRLIEIYKVSLDREAGERTRSSARNLLRNKFATTDSDDRMEIIWKTEGRALGSLSGLSIDSKTAALICARQIMSVAIVQNFTRFAATPPSVITHFLRQPLVKRQIHLRNALLKHPNCPSDAKRAF